MRRAAVVVFALILAATCLTPLYGCSVGASTQASSSATQTADPGGPYLGQAPPGNTPQIFAPGIVSIGGATEWCGTFSPDGSEYYFYRYLPDSPSRLYFSRLENGAWTPPAMCQFAGEYEAAEPCFNADGSRLYFNWWYPVPEGQPGHDSFSTYYFVERTVSGWSEPVYAGQGMFMTASRDGKLYTTDVSGLKPVGGGMLAPGLTYLVEIKTADGVFTGYERININTYLGTQAHPCIARDGSYMLFDVGGGNHLFVSFKASDGTWGDAIDLTKYGFDWLAGGATISPDGKYLFFALRGDIWWVDIGVVESLRPAG